MPEIKRLIFTNSKFAGCNKCRQIIPMNMSVSSMEALEQNDFFILYQPNLYQLFQQSAVRQHR